MSYSAAVRTYVIDNFLFGDSDHFTDDTSFLESGIIDSTGVLELIDFIENTYTITIRDHEIIPENLDSVNNIVAFLKNRLNGSGELCA